MATNHNPDLRESHLFALLSSRQIDCGDIARALKLDENDILRALHPEHWLEISLLKNVLVRREVESRLYASGWRGEAAGLWQAHRDVFAAFGDNEDLQQ